MTEKSSARLLLVGKHDPITGYSYLSWFVLIGAIESWYPVYIPGRLLAEIISTHFSSSALYIPTYSVRRVWVRQTRLLNTAAWWSKPIDHPISSPINHLLSFALSPSNPLSCTVSPFFVPYFPLPFSLSLSVLLPLTPHSSREVQSGPTSTIHVTIRTVKYSTGCFKQVVLLR